MRESARFLSAMGGYYFWAKLYERSACGYFMVGKMGFCAKRRLRVRQTFQLAVEPDLKLVSGPPPHQTNKTPTHQAQTGFSKILPARFRNRAPRWRPSHRPSKAICVRDGHKSGERADTPSRTRVGFVRILSNSPQLGDAAGQGLALHHARPHRAPDPVRQV